MPPEYAACKSSFEARGFLLSRLTLCLLLFMIWNFAENLSALTLEHGQDSIEVGRALAFYEDADGDKSIDVIRSIDQSAWQQSETDHPVFGYTESVYWSKMRLIQSDSAIKPDWLLEIAYPHLDRVDIYIFAGEQLVNIFRVGDHYPFFNRYINYRNFILPINFDRSEEIDIYLRVKSSSSVQMPMKLYERDAFLDRKLTELFSLGVYYGTIVVMMLYNFFLYLSFRDKIYAYYVLYLFGWIGFQLSYNGLAFQYIWPGYPEIVDKSIPFFQSFSGLFFLLFTISFLKTKRYAPVFHLILKVLIGFCLANFILIAFSTKVAIILGVASGFLLSLTGLVSGIVALLRGYRPARFFVLAFAAFLCGLSLLAFNALGLFENDFISNYAVQIGSSLEAILLSFALGDKINLEQRSYNRSIKTLNSELQMTVESEQESRRRLEKSEANLRLLNEELEEKVREKTQQLIQRNEKALQRFLPPEVVDDVLSGKVTLQEEPKREFVTVMFVDLVNFTKSAESLGAEKTGMILNEYLGKVSQTIFEHHGTIDKYLGDGIMIVFGFPAATNPKEQVANAIATAIGILGDLRQLNAVWSAGELPTFQVRIGMHSGPVVVGSFGGQFRSDYTAIGPTVNIAARIEAQAEADSIFLSESCAHYISSIPLDDRGVFQLKGVSMPMQLFSINQGYISECFSDYSYSA